MASTASRLIDLRKGHPAARHLPHARLAAATRRAALRLERASEAEFPLNYCSDQHGTRRFRRSLGKYLSAAYDGPVSPKWLLTTNGVSHGLELATAALSRPGDTVIVEEPTYFLVHQIFRDHGLRVEGLPGDRNGLNVEALARRCADQSKPTPKLVYVVPTHGNPSGANLTPGRRALLVELARTHGFYILADEVYQLLDWSPIGAPPRLLTYDLPYKALLKSLRAKSASVDAAVSEGDCGESDGGGDDDDAAYTGRGADTTAAADLGDAADARVLSVTSFTKILSPGLRLGWIEASPALLKRIAARGYLVSGGGVAPFVSEVAVEMLSSGEQADHLAELCTTYRSSCSALCSALRKELDDNGEHLFDFEEPTGGYFCWVRLPEGVDASDLLPLAEGNGVAFLPGSRCMLEVPEKGLGGSSWIRLCFAYEEEALMATAVERLTAAVREQLEAEKLVQAFLTASIKC